jgi:hypothetical protein
MMHTKVFTSKIKKSKLLLPVMAVLVLTIIAVMPTKSLAAPPQQNLIVAPSHTFSLVFTGKTTTGVPLTGSINGQIEDKGQGTGLIDFVSATGTVTSFQPSGNGPPETDTLSNIKAQQTPAGTLVITADFKDPSGKTGTYTIKPVFSTNVSIDDTKDTFPKGYTTTNGDLTAQYTGGNPISGTLAFSSLLINK